MDYSSNDPDTNHVKLESFSPMEYDSWNGVKCSTPRRPPFLNRRFPRMRASRRRMNVPPPFNYVPGHMHSWYQHDPRYLQHCSYVYPGNPGLIHNYENRPFFGGDFGDLPNHAKQRSCSDFDGSPHPLKQTISKADSDWTDYIDAYCKQALETFQGSDCSKLSGMDLGNKRSTFNETQQKYESHQHNGHSHEVQCKIEQPSEIQCLFDQVQVKSDDFERSKFLPVDPTGISDYTSYNVEENPESSNLTTQESGNIEIQITENSHQSYSSVSSIGEQISNTGISQQLFHDTTACNGVTNGPDSEDPTYSSTVIDSRTSTSENPPHSQDETALAVFNLQKLDSPIIVSSELENLYNQYFGDATSEVDNSVPFDNVSTLTEESNNESKNTVQENQNTYSLNTNLDNNPHLIDVHLNDNTPCVSNNLNTQLEKLFNDLFSVNEDELCSSKQDIISISDGSSALQHTLNNSTSEQALVSADMTCKQITNKNVCFEDVENLNLRSPAGAPKYEILTNESLNQPSPINLLIKQNQLLTDLLSKAFGINSESSSNQVSLNHSFTADSLPFSTPVKALKTKKGKKRKIVECLNDSGSSAVTEHFLSSNNSSYIRKVTESLDNSAHSGIMFSSTNYNILEEPPRNISNYSCLLDTEPPEDITACVAPSDIFPSQTRQKRVLKVPKKVRKQAPRSRRRTLSCVREMAEGINIEKTIDQFIKDSIQNDPTITGEVPFRTYCNVSTGMMTKSYSDAETQVSRELHRDAETQVSIEEKMKIFRDAETQWFDMGRHEETKECSYNTDPQLLALNGKNSPLGSTTHSNSSSSADANSIKEYAITKNVSVVLDLITCEQKISRIQDDGLEIDTWESEDSLDNDILPSDKGSDSKLTLHKLSRSRHIPSLKNDVQINKTASKMLTEQKQTTKNSSTPLSYGIFLQMDEGQGSEKILKEKIKSGKSSKIPTLKDTFSVIDKCSANESMIKLQKERKKGSESLKMPNCNSKTSTTDKDPLNESLLKIRKEKKKAVQCSSESNIKANDLPVNKNKTLLVDEVSTIPIKVLKKRKNTYFDDLTKLCKIPKNDGDQLKKSPIHRFKNRAKKCDLTTKTRTRSGRQKVTNI